MIWLVFDDITQTLSNNNYWGGIRLPPSTLTDRETDSIVFILNGLVRSN